jgi:hypothetical protein
MSSLYSLGSFTNHSTTKVDESVVQRVESEQMLRRFGRSRLFKLLNVFLSHESTILLDTSRIELNLALLSSHFDTLLSLSCMSTTSSSSISNVGEVSSSLLPLEEIKMSIEKNHFSIQNSILKKEYTIETNGTKFNCKSTQQGREIIYFFLFDHLLQKMV